MQEPKADLSAESVAAGAARSFGAVLHDLRRALGRGANDAPGDPPSAEFAILRALDAVARGERLVCELLAYAGRAALRPAAVEPLPLLCALAHTLRSTLGTGIDVAVDVARDCPTCFADAAALEAALLNLAINARDAMPPHGSLRLAAEGDGAAGAVVFIVEDTGRGMDAEVAAKAALPFFTTRDDPLAGMGLATADGFARQSGGRLDLRSRPGRGTTVRLSVPAAAPVQR
jgi:signal transduction histidine kinase